MRNKKRKTLAQKEVAAPGKKRSKYALKHARRSKGADNPNSPFTPIKE